METVGNESKPKTGVTIVNIRTITFETDVQRLRKIREELCNLDLNKSLEPIDTEEEEGLMDEIRVLFDGIIEADSRSKLSSVPMSENIGPTDELNEISKRLRLKWPNKYI
jgi:hypothetical protein